MSLPPSRRRFLCQSGRGSRWVHVNSSVKLTANYFQLSCPMLFAWKRTLQNQPRPSWFYPWLLTLLENIAQQCFNTWQIILRVYIYIPVLYCVLYIQYLKHHLETVLSSKSSLNEIEFHRRVGVRKCFVLSVLGGSCHVSPSNHWDQAQNLKCKRARNLCEDACLFWLWALNHLHLSCCC